MPTLNPRVHVTFNPSDTEVMKLICEKKNLTMSSLVRKVIEDWLEEYEDALLAKRAEDAEKEWLENGGNTYTMEQVCQELNIELNSPKNPKKTYINSRRTSKKQS
jgi:predicted DNA-binding protein